MRTRTYLSASERRQANRKCCHEKRPGAFQLSRPSISVARYSPASKDEQPWTA